MKVKESYNYDDIERKNNLIIPGAENKFITEKLLLFPLYKKIDVDLKMKPYEFFPVNNFTIECYCKECNIRRIYTFENSSIAYEYMFKASNPGSHNSSSSGYKIIALQNEIDKQEYFTFFAKADCNHNMIVVFKKIDNKTIMKVGQYPSIYDLNENINNKDFIKLLGDEYSGYYKNACSLSSFNSYIGALTYLRRIYEKLLIDAFNENSDNLDISLDDFKNIRMDEKILYLKASLPSIMFEQGFNNIYKKISDGIHNLSEEDCCKMFPILKKGIEEILIEKLEKIEKNKRITELTKELQNV